MAIEIISSNLNEIGNAGSFESDISTWGFTLDGFGNLSRDASRAYAGLYSQKCSPLVDFSEFLGAFAVTKAKASALVYGNTYLLRARIFVDNASPIAPDDCEFSWNGLIIPYLISETKKTVAEARGAWVEVEGKFTASIITGPEFVLFLRQIDIANHINLSNFVWVDKVEIYQYIEVSETCTLVIDTDSTVVTNETAPAANDGSITVATTAGTGPFEYSKNNGASWQSSNLFAGLAPGVYTVKVREIATPSCESTQTFAVNSAAATFSFTTAKTDESIIGAADGSIVVTVTGTVAPFTYSKDGGATFQSGNLFENLAAGTYTIVVKDADDVILAANVTIEAGTVIFEKVWLHGNFITKSQSASTGWEAAINYRIYDDVRVEDEAGSGTFISKLKIALPPDSTGLALLQVRQAFRKIMEPVAPVYSEDIIRLTDRIKFFKHYTGELEGTEETPAILTESLPNLVVWGGLDKFNYPDYDFFAEYPTHKKFMSWAPLTKQVDPLQPDYLNFWLYKSTSNELHLKVKAYYDDNTNQTATTASISPVAYGRLYQVPTGPANSGVKFIDPEKNVVKYDLWLEDQSGIISEVRTYVLDAFSIPDVRLFMFANSLGSFEVMRFYGAAEITNGFEREIIQKYLAPGYASITGEKAVHRATRIKKESYSSGYFKGLLAKEWQDYMNDFMLSPYVYEIMGTTLRPVIITDGSIETIDKDFKRFFRFTAEDGYDNNFYTPTI